MSQSQTTPWVIVTRMKEDVKPEEIGRIASQVAALIDDWQSGGKIMWSGAFDDPASSMAVFEATEPEAKAFYKRYGDVCSGVLNHYLYQWGAMPILSLLSKH